MEKERSGRHVKDTLTKAPEAQKQSAQSSKQPGIWQDARFQHLVADPRFKSIPKTHRKVKIDKRFQGMFTDEKFQVKYTVDKYGRKVNKSNADDLRKYYELETSSEDEAKVEEQDRRKEEKAISRDTDEAVADSSADEAPAVDNDALESDEEQEEIPKTLKEQLLNPNVDYARGEGRLVTDSSSGEESSDDDDENDPVLKIDHVWGELDAVADTTDDSTRRLAVCNMDWDRVRAVDLMVLFNSFLPPGGSIVNVKIYPSDYGKDRMAKEEAHGPPELVGLGKAVTKKVEKSSNQGGVQTEDDDESIINASDSEDDESVQEQDSDAAEGDEYHMEKLREYQLNRLRYYYAVVECDTVQTADKIYSECDGIEYESSATKIDLRFVPDDTSFDDDEPKDVCTELPEVSAYQPRQFTTTALHQAKVNLTWDETAVERRELGDKLSSGKLDAVSDKDLRSIVAYSSEEDEEDIKEEKAEAGPAIGNGVEKINKPAKKEKIASKTKKQDTISKYKALLAEINENEQKEKNKKFEMELSWNVNASKADDVNEKGQTELTPIEKVLQKRNEKNKKRKEDRKKKKLQAKGIDPDDDNNDTDSDNEQHGIDMNDPYFAEEFADGDFIDPKAKRKEQSKKLRQARDDAEKEAEEQAQALQLLLEDDDELEKQGKQHFSLSKIQKAEDETKSKKKRRKQLKKSKAAVAEERKELEDSFQLDLNDQRFGAIYKSHLFNIDPTDSHFKKTKGMEQIIHEKLKRRHGSESNDVNEHKTESNGNEVTVASSKRPKRQLENNLLVQNLKRKIQAKQQR